MSRRIIETGITKEMLSGDDFPQLQITDKLYVVDNRKKTFDKIQEIQADETLKENEKTKKIYTLALGAEAANEIIDMDLSVEKTIYLSYCIMGAITGEDPNKLMEEARNSKN